MGLKKSDIEKFKKRLEELRAQLTHTLKGSTAEVKTPDESTGYSQHQADQGTDERVRGILEMAAKKTTVVIAQSPGKNPVKRNMEETIAATLLLDSQVWLAAGEPVWHLVPAGVEPLLATDGPG
jgi:hypothetical protein